MFRFVHVDGSTSTSTSSVKNQGIGRISDKCKINGSRKIKTACYCKRCCTYTSGVIKCELVVLPSWHCFRNPDASDPRLCLVCHVRQWLRTTLKELLQDTPRKSGCEYCLTNVARACNFFYHKCKICALSDIKRRTRSDERMGYSRCAFYQG